MKLNFPAMASIFFTLLFAHSATADQVSVAETYEVSCDFLIYGAPFATVSLSVAKDGIVGDARVTAHGRSHSETATQEPNAIDERLHLWLSKENPDGRIEMIVYKTRRPKGLALLFNPNVPTGKEMWGDCRFKLTVH